MKKLLTGLMLATASFMLLFSISDIYANEDFDLVHVEFEILELDGSDGIITPSTFDALNNYAEFSIVYISINDVDAKTLYSEFDMFFYGHLNVFGFGDFDNYDYYFYINPDDTISNVGISVAVGDVIKITFEVPTAKKLYQDLFYETVEVEFEVLGDSFTSSDVYQDLILYSVFEETYITNLVALYDNDVLVTDYQFSLEIDGFVLTSSSKYYFFDLKDSGNFNNYDMEVGDVLTFHFEATKSWNQTYDYGRVRHGDNSTVRLILDDDVVKPVNNTNDDYFNHSLLEENDEIVIQSPYNNFKIYRRNPGTGVETTLESFDNVAAVVFKFYRVGTTPYKDFEIYYWDTNNSIQKTELLEYHFAADLHIAFYGGIRKAIDYQDLMVANVDELTPLEDFLGNIVAWDAIDGDISDQVYIVDDGGYASDVVSVYNVEFGVENSNGLESTVIVPVHVVDIVAPVISGVFDTVQIGYSETFNVANWVASLTVSDNYYEGLTISLVTDTYTTNKSKLGTYEVTVRAVDPSGNQSTLTREIEVVDGIGPVFSGIETITSSINELLTAEQIKGGIAAIDAIDGNVTSSITIDTDGLAGNNQTPGTYDVIFKAEDAAGNQTFYLVKATIVATPPGIYIINANSVRLLPGANLTIEQILDILGASEAVGVSTNYDANTPGVYSLSFTLDDEDYRVGITLLGVDDPILPEPIIPEAPSNFNAVYYVLGAALTVAVLVIIIKKRK